MKVWGVTAAFPLKVRVISTATAVRGPRGKGGTRFKKFEPRPLVDRDHDLAIAEHRSKPGDMDCERRLNSPHSAVIPPSTNSRAPVT